MSVDTVDSAGENQINILGGLRTLELDKFGHPALGDRKAQAGECLPCLEAADVDDSGRIDMEDGVGLLNFIFRQGEAPPPPLYEALPDLDSDELGCESTGD